MLIYGLGVSVYRRLIYGLGVSEQGWGLIYGLGLGVQRGADIWARNGCAEPTQASSSLNHAR